MCLCFLCNQNFPSRMLCLLLIFFMQVSHHTKNKLQFAFIINTSRLLGVFGTTATTPCRLACADITVSE